MEFIGRLLQRKDGEKDMIGISYFFPREMVLLTYS